MKIMCLAEAYSPDIDVAALRVQEMAGAFSRQADTDTTVVVFNPRVNDPVSRRTIHKSGNITVIRYERKYLSRLLRVAQLVGIFTVVYWIYLIMKEVRANKPDIVIASIPGLAPAAAVYAVSKVCRFPFCIDVRDSWFEPHFENYVVSQMPWYAKLYGRISYKISFRLFRAACKNAMLVSVVYETIADDLKKISGFRTPVIHVPNGVNLDEIRIVKTGEKKTTLSKYGIPADNESRTIIFVGMVGGYYRPDVLIPALKKINDNGICLNYVIVGDGELKDKIVETAAKEGIAQHVFTPGKLGHGGVIELLLASDIAFYALDKDFPAANSALGVKIIEYIACKLPLISISQENSSVARMIADHGIGVALQWDQLENLGASIERVLTSPEYARRIDEYYPDFIGTFNRSSNNQRLYDKIREVYKTKK